MDQKPTTFRVLLPLPLNEGYDYLPLPNQKLSQGSIVEVPLGSKKVIGVVWGLGEGTVEASKLKSIYKILDLPALPKATCQFVDWVSQYTINPKGSVLKMVFGSMKHVHLKKNDNPQPTDFNPNFHIPKLTDNQLLAAEALVQKVNELQFSVTLLDGVTGSGKTEVFSEAVAECLRQKKQALVMLPEIAMTAALIDRLAHRFGAKPIEWHSELSEKQRRLNWHAILKGEAQFVLGARSALFLPYHNLGLIVVDEEHEAAYKQEEGVVYHGRDMAVVRAHLGAIPIVLSSATPSLETSYNVQLNKYDHVQIKERYGKASMPQIGLVDIRQHAMKATHFITPPLLEALRDTFQNKQQSMLYLNRRGYAPLTLCRACGHRLQCPNCTSWLIEHKHSKALHCHHCNYSMPMPKACPACHADNRFAACGPGIERIADEVKKLLPELRVAVMSSDTLKGPQSAEELLTKMNQSELDLLIGTQIMAKGYHFPNLTFVGVIDADLGLSGGDPRAAERTFQLLQQVSGRSGRSDKPGRVLVQTTSPENPVMQALVSGDRDAFMQAELREREAYHLPPVWRLAHVTISGSHMKYVIAEAQKIVAQAPRMEHFRVLGPAPAPLAMLRGRYRQRLLVQSSRSVNLPTVLRAWLSSLKISKSIRVIVDIDPYSFL